MVVGVLEASFVGFTCRRANGGEDAYVVWVFLENVLDALLEVPRHGFKLVLLNRPAKLFEYNGVLSEAGGGIVDKLSTEDSQRGHRVDLGQS